LPLTLLNKLPRFPAWREYGSSLRGFRGAETKGLIMGQHPHLPGARHQEDQKWHEGALAGRMEALGVIPRLSAVEVPEDNQMALCRGEVDELTRQGTPKVTPGRNAKVDAVIARSLNKAKTVPVQVGMPDPDESWVAEHPADGTADPPPLSSFKIGLWSKKSLVEQEAQRDGA
jgi:hypothetical protein